MEILDGKYNLRPFRPGDEEGILALWEIAFKSRMPLERFKWKYLENPYDKTMMLCVAKNGEIVTFYGGIPYKFQYQDTIARGVQLMDIMSHPGHSENRVFAKTAYQFISTFCTPDQLLYMYGFPGAFHYSIGERILNYQKVNPAAYLQARVKDLFNGQEGEKGNTEIRMEKTKNLDFDDPEWKKLWENCSQDYPFALVRDSEFVKWRFFDHPIKEYQVLKFIDKAGGDMVGYAVLFIQPDQPEKVILVDLLLKDSLPLFRDIMGCVGEYLLNKKVETLDTWLPDNHFLARHARAAGFKQSKEPLGIIPTVALFKQSPSLDWITSRLYYSMADADLF